MVHSHQERCNKEPRKVRVIKEFPEPKTVYEVRSFLGLANLRWKGPSQKYENGTVRRSRSIQMRFSEAFHKLRYILETEDLMLSYTDYKKPFDLMTDASAYGIGAVLA